MSVLSEIRRLPGAIHDLAFGVAQCAVRLETLIKLQDENGPSDERLEALERSRARWEAEMEAQLLKADSTLKSASNAESRSRTMLRHAEKHADPFAEEGEEVEAPVLGLDDPRIEEERLLPVPMDLASNNKAHALRAKWL